MPTRSEALEMVRRELGSFVRARELRLLHVVSGVEGRAAVLEIARAMEFHADARGPFVVLDDASLGDARGWSERVERLRAEHAQRLEAVPDLLSPMVWDNEHIEREPVARFGAAIRAFADTLPTDGPVLTLVLAPTRLENTSRWCDDLRALLARSELSRVRWVLVDEGEGATSAADLGALARRWTVAFDASDVGALLDTITYTRDGAPNLGRFGRAGPSVQCAPSEGAPARYAAVQPPERRASRDAGEAPEQVRAKVALMVGAAAAQRGDMVAAIEAQTEAVEWAGSGPARERIVHQMTLAGYALVAGAMDEALVAYERAAKWAREAELFPLEAQARLACGGIFEARERHAEAAGAFGQSATLAERGESLVLAVGAWQLAARHAERLGNLPEAVGAYGQAMRIAETDEDVAAAVEAPAIGRRLAALLERLELAEQVEQVELVGRVSGGDETSANASSDASED